MVLHAVFRTEDRSFCLQQRFSVPARKPCLNYRGLQMKYYPEGAIRQAECASAPGRKRPWTISTARWPRLGQVKKSSTFGFSPTNAQTLHGPRAAPTRRGCVRHGSLRGLPWQYGFRTSVRRMHAACIPLGMHMTPFDVVTPGLTGPLWEFCRGWASVQFRVWE